MWIIFRCLDGVPTLILGPSERRQLKLFLLLLKLLKLGEERGGSLRVGSEVVLRQLWRIRRLGRWTADIVLSMVLHQSHILVQLMSEVVTVHVSVCGDCLVGE